MTIGVTLAMVGFCMYSHTKLKHQPQPAKTQAAKADTIKQDVEEGQPLLPAQEQQLTTRAHHK